MCFATITSFVWVPMILLSSKLVYYNLGKIIGAIS